ncbi:MAG: RIP metalloprotease RseP [Gammaproteobacteria bacterium AqS3]|nr:RIP metalloprotease RseP [Gammaproteobacteria bacterium AqS3]
MSLLMAVFVLGLLVALHELGHFLAARSAGAAVHTFSIGFGPVLTSIYSPRGTRFAISALPLGGYVRMLSRLEEAQVGGLQNVVGTRYESLSVAQRAWIAVAGPLANFIVAWMLFFVLTQLPHTHLRPVIGPVAADSPALQAGFRPGDEILSVRGEPVIGMDKFSEALAALQGEDIDVEVRNPDGILRTRTLSAGAVQTFEGWGFSLPKPTMPPKIAFVTEDEPAHRAGLRPGDLLIGANGVELQSWSDWTPVLRNNPGAQIDITYVRDGQERTVQAELQSKTQSTGELYGYLGAAARDQWEDEMLVEHHHAIHRGLIESFNQSVHASGLMLSGFARMLTGGISPAELSGPIGIVRIGAQFTELEGMNGLLVFAAIISLALMVFNLLPIPGLDGGALLMLALEHFKGSVPDSGVVRAWTYGGYALLLGLFCLALFNDFASLL